jgi:hypothetical protein
LRLVLKNSDWDIWLFSDKFDLAHRVKSSENYIGEGESMIFRLAQELGF